MVIDGVALPKSSEASQRTKSCCKLVPPSIDRRARGARRFLSRSGDAIAKRAAPRQGHHNGYRTGRLRTAEGFVDYSALQVVGAADWWLTRQRHECSRRTLTLALPTCASQGCIAKRSGPGIFSSVSSYRSAQDHAEYLRRTGRLKLMFAHACGRAVTFSESHRLPPPTVEENYEAQVGS